MARKQFPGGSNSLDNLCKRLDIDNSHRSLHGALLDSEILADAYLRMTGGQSQLLFDTTESPKTSDQSYNRREMMNSSNTVALQTCIIQATAEEENAHQDYLTFLQEKSDTYQSHWGQRKH
jgi:DNA polymerase-3 subunit epsilon